MRPTGTEIGRNLDDVDGKVNTARDLLSLRESLRPTYGRSFVDVIDSMEVNGSGHMHEVRFVLSQQIVQSPTACAAQASKLMHDQADRYFPAIGRVSNILRRRLFRDQAQEFVEAFDDDVVAMLTELATRIDSRLPVVVPEPAQLANVRASVRGFIEDVNREERYGTGKPTAPTYLHSVAVELLAILDAPAQPARKDVGYLQTRFTAMAFADHPDTLFKSANGVAPGTGYEFFQRLWLLTESAAVMTGQRCMSQSLRRLLKPLEVH
jgi:hypothetical protein